MSEQMSNTPEQTAKEQYYDKREKILKKFGYDFVYKYYKTDPMAHAVIELLMQDTDPYEIIERLIEDRIKLVKQFTDYMELNAKPMFYNPQTELKK